MGFQNNTGSKMTPSVLAQFSDDGFADESRRSDRYLQGPAPPDYSKVYGPGETFSAPQHQVMMGKPPRQITGVAEVDTTIQILLEAVALFKNIIWLLLFIVLVQAAAIVRLAGGVSVPGTLGI